MTPNGSLLKGCEGRAVPRAAQERTAPGAEDGGARANKEMMPMGREERLHRWVGRGASENGFASIPMYTIPWMDGTA